MKRGGPIKRTPLKRGTKPIARSTKPVRAVSDKRRVENVERRGVLDAMRAAEPWCHARVVRNCTNQPDDGHEILTRARGGSITDSANIILVCRLCHTWITDHPVEAAELGLVRHSWDV